MLSGPTRVFGPVSKLGCMVTPCWGKGGLYGYFLLGKMGFMVIPRWGTGWVLWLLHAGKKIIKSKNKEKDRSKK